MGAPPAMDLVAATSKLVLLAKSGSIAAARRLFDTMPARDTVAWNAMLACYARSDMPNQAFALFSAMRASNSSPDAFSLTAALSAATAARSLRAGAKLHAVAVALGLLPASSPVSNALIDMYGKLHCPLIAEQVFVEMEAPNDVSWCSLLSAYAASGWLQQARRLFDEMPERNSVACNALMGGYARRGDVESAVSLFMETAAKGITGDLYTFSLFASLCSDMEDLRLGFSVHGLILKLGWISAVEVGNAIISFYSKLALSDNAQKMFDSIPARTQVSWNTAMDAHMRSGDVKAALSLFSTAPARNAVSYTTIINGMAHNGKPHRALQLFSDMIAGGFSPDEVTFTPVLQSCSALALLQHGTAAHCSLLRRGFQSDVFLCNGLINMYAKCGDMRGSAMVFLCASFRDLVSWNSLLLGMSLHGMAAAAMAAYREMEKNMKPDRFTLSGLLIGCNHAGMVEQGMSLFMEMGEDEEHAACAMDMLERAGMGAEAAELAAHLGEPEAEEAAEMVARSNEWCSRGRWEAAAEVRREMAARGMRKEAGCSWVESNGEVAAFGSGGVYGLPEAAAVGKMVKWLEMEMKSPS